VYLVLGRSDQQGSKSFPASTRKCFVCGDHSQSTTSFASLRSRVLLPASCALSLINSSNIIIFAVVMYLRWQGVTRSAKFGIQEYGFV
jgi:hypothetical protein